jgi:hypothetical protein
MKSVLVAPLLEVSGLRRLVRTSKRNVVLQREVVPQEIGLLGLPSLMAG